MYFVHITPVFSYSVMYSYENVSLLIGPVDSQQNSETGPVDSHQFSEITNSGSSKGQ